MTETTVPAVLEVRGLYKYFPVHQPMIDSLIRRPQEQVKAVDNVSFSLARGEVLAIVGESGCGKTTIARTLIGLEERTKGEILFDGQLVAPLPAQRGSEGSGVAPLPAQRGSEGSGVAPLPAQRGSEGSGVQANAKDKQNLPHIGLKQLRQRAQMIFQDPYESLNPRETIFEIVAEPLDVHGIAKDRQQRIAVVKSALEDAGLRPAEDYYLRYPHELSGGQRQRVVIAAAMVLQPELLIADEPVSMLDVSIRAEILNLLRELRQKRGISIVFITHDLSTVAYFADKIAVMYLGRIVEIGTAQEVLKNPQHPYTKALLSVVPVPNPRLRRERVILQGETPNPINLPVGCRFHPRCPVAVKICKASDPHLFPVSETHEAACLLLVK